MPKSVCPPVCHTRKPRLNGSRYRNILCTTRQRTFLVSGDQICNTEFRACGRNDCIKQRHPLETAKIGPIIHHISGTGKIGRRLLLFTHRKSHTCFTLVPKSVTLNDLEGLNCTTAVILRYFTEFVLYRTLTLGKSWLRPQLPRTDCTAPFNVTVRLKSTVRRYKPASFYRAALYATQSF